MQGHAGTKIISGKDAFLHNLCLFPPPAANIKFNPAMKMHALLVELLKSEPLVFVMNLTTNTQLVLSKEQILMNEDDFKKFFTISTNLHATMNKQHIIIGCILLSERTLKEIKFDKAKPQFMEWHAQEKVFIESNLLGVHKTMTIGYITKLHPKLTNHNNLKTLLQIALEDVIINLNLAAKLDPSLKAAVVVAKANAISSIQRYCHSKYIRQNCPWT